MTEPSRSIQTPTKLPRINLPRLNVTEFSMRAVFPKTRDNSDALQPLVENQRMFTSGTPYSLGGKKHLITAIVDPAEESIDQWVIWMDYDATDYPDTVSVPLRDRRESEFLACALQLEEVIEFRCNIDYAFPEVDDSDLWFPLPSQIGGTSVDEETFLLVGVQAVKRPGAASEEPSYGFHLSRSPDGSVSLDVAFQLSSSFNADLPRQVLDRGESIAVRLVGPRAARTRSKK